MMLKLDASALIYAIKGNYQNILKKVYNELIIIDTIYEETVIKGKKHEKRDAYVLDKLIDDGFFIRHPDSKNLPDMPMGKGEIAVIQSAIEENCIALIDDQQARKIAVQRGVKVQWTCLAFLKALKQKLITEAEFDSCLTQYAKVASLSILEYQTILEIKKLVM